MSTNINTQYHSSNYNPQSKMYTREGYSTLLSISHFVGGSFLGYGILETVDKLELTKSNKTNLKEIAIKNTKRNVILGVLFGALCFLIGKLTNKATIPLTEKMYNLEASVNKN